MEGKIMNTIKKIILAAVISLFFSLSITVAQNDTMYIMKSGVVIDKFNINTEVDSLIFYILEPPTCGILFDSRDGNEYRTVQIGNQCWMAENLRYLPSVTGPSALYPDYYNKYYVYGYDGTNVDEAKATNNYANYGVLYGWLAAMAWTESSEENPIGVQGVCPDGWHLPSSEEWEQLIDFVGGMEHGGKLKAVSTNHWNSPNAGATNETGFKALPGGFYNMIFSDGTFLGLGDQGRWWSATEPHDYIASYYGLFFNHNYFIKGWEFKEFGFSVRCVKN